MWLLCIANKIDSFEGDCFIPNDEGFLRVRSSIIAPFLTRGPNFNNDREITHIIGIINGYIPRSDPKHFLSYGGRSPCWDYGKNYYVSIVDDKNIVVTNLNTLEKRTIFKRGLAENLKMVCLSPDEKFLSIACEVTTSGAACRNVCKLILKTISLEDNYFYHETLIDRTEQYLETIALFYTCSNRLVSRHISKPFKEKYLTMFVASKGRGLPGTSQWEHACVLTLEKLHHEHSSFAVTALSS